MKNFMSKLVLTVVFVFMIVVVVPSFKVSEFENIVTEETILWLSENSETFLIVFRSIATAIFLPLYASFFTLFGLPKKEESYEVEDVEQTKRNAYFDAAEKTLQTILEKLKKWDKDYAKADWVNVLFSDYIEFAKRAKVDPEEINVDMKNALDQFVALWADRANVKQIMAFEKLEKELQEKIRA